MKKKNTAVHNHIAPSLIGRVRGGSLLLFFLLSWLWASWWMGDVLRIAYERSFFAADATLMHWLWQRSYGPLWIIGRALLTLYRWPVAGGLFVALLLSAGSWLFGSCLRLPRCWRWVQYLPATAWMIWTAHVGINLYYMAEPGRILGLPFLFVVVCAVVKTLSLLPLKGESGHSQEKSSGQIHYALPLKGERGGGLEFVQVLLLPFLFVLPMFYLNHRHPYLRPLTRMEVQLMNEDYEGISRTAHEYADMGCRQMAGYYVIALARTGHLADQLFDIRLDYNTIPAYGYSGKPNPCLEYHLIDCNYHAGLIRAARHTVMEDLTMNGPSLFTLKYMVKISLIEGDWALARKYLRILRQVPFEGAFLREYEPLVGHPDLVQASPKFAAVIKALPPYHTVEQLYLKPGFVGFYANLQRSNNPEALTWSAMACLYGKRMPDFLLRCQKLVGTTPPRSIAEGLIIEAQKHPAILEAFPQLQMDMERFGLFVEDALPYMKDRRLGADQLFDKYRGYYPYYYYFGNLPAEVLTAVEEEHNKAGVN